MIRQYVGEALQRVSYSVLKSNVYRATVTGLRGVIATGTTLGTCRDQQAEIVEGPGSVLEWNEEGALSSSGGKGGTRPLTITSRGEWV